MKKKLSIGIFLLSMCFIIGCKNNSNNKEDEKTCIEDPSQDKCKQIVQNCFQNPNQDKCKSDLMAPILRFDGDNGIGNVTINLFVGEEYDPLEGVTASDNAEGIMNDYIIVTGAKEFDSSKEGTYTINFTVSDAAKNTTSRDKIIIVSKNYNVLTNYSVYTGEIANEANAPSPQRCFGGAWYHKVMSSTDYWVGVEGTVTLPSFDINRYRDDAIVSTNYSLDYKNLDNPSIYLGGNADAESDVGLSLSIGLTGGNTVSAKGSFVYRPFWRYITSSQYHDAGSYDVHDGKYAVSCNGNNCNSNWSYKETKFYYLPGDKLRIIVHVPEVNYMQLQIEVLEVSKDPTSIALRSQYNWEDPADFFSPLFRSEGHGRTTAEFKRVNAIDQVNNEGKEAVDTTTIINEAIWESSYLYRKINGVIYKVPMTSRRSVTMNCPNEKAFIITEYNNEMGGEKIIISPNNIYANTVNKIFYKKDKDEE